MANILSTWQNMPPEQQSSYEQMALHRKQEGEYYQQKEKDTPKTVNNSIVQGETITPTTKPLVVPDKLERQGDKILSSGTTQTLQAKQNEGIHQLTDYATKVKAPDKIDNIDTGFVPKKKKTWRDYLLGSKDDQEFNNRRKQTIAAVHDLVTNLGNLYATSQGAMSQKYESATDKIAKQKAKDAEKEKADLEMALATMKVQQQMQNDERNYKLRLGEYGLKQNEDTRQNQLHPWKILEQKGKADFQANKAAIQAATAGDVIRGQKADADLAETEAKFATQQQQATLANKRASTAHLNASTRHIASEDGSGSGGGKGKQDGKPFAYNKQTKETEYFKTQDAANTAAQSYGTFNYQNKTEQRVSKKHDPVTGRTTADTTTVTRSGGGYPMTREEYEGKKNKYTKQNPWN